MRLLWCSAAPHQHGGTARCSAANPLINLGSGATTVCPGHSQTAQPQRLAHLQVHPLTHTVDEGKQNSTHKCMRKQERAHMHTQTQSKIEVLIVVGRGLARSVKFCQVNRYLNDYRINSWGGGVGGKSLNAT